MQKTMAGATILEYELSELRLLVERQTGALLDCPSSALAAHVGEYLESHELESAAILLDRLRSGDQDPAVLPQFLEGLLNTNTGFFRHPGAMNALTRQVLPSLYSRKSAEGGSVRIWSAGCSTGEEAYSIAMAVCEAGALGSAANGNGCAPGGFSGGGHNGAEKEKDVKEKSGKSRNGGISETAVSSPPSPVHFPKDCSIHIVGSDLLPSAIRTAERGLYPQSALNGLPPAAIRASFSKIAIANRANSLDKVALDRPRFGGSSNGPQNEFANGPRNGRSSALPRNSLDSVSLEPEAASPAPHLLVKPRLRSLVTFNTMNLVRPVYIGRFDCIFCMDVLPYLSRAQRLGLLERLHLYLEPGGYLFLSQSEKPSAPNLNFRAETFDGYTFYRKPLAASAAYGR